MERLKGRLKLHLIKRGGLTKGGKCGKRLKKGGKKRLKQRGLKKVKKG